MIKLYVGYLIAAIILFIIEFFIGANMHDSITRPYGGDFLVVILIYCIAKSFINAPVLKTALIVLLIAYAVEVSQYFHLIVFLGLQQSGTARLLLGTSFSLTDLIAYTLGTLTILIVENLRFSLKKFLI